jgi:copper resistance protein C
VKASRNIALIALLGAVALGLGGTSAWAHALPSAEQPLVGSTVNAPPSKVTIWFDAPIESLFAKLQVLDAAGRDQSEGSPIVGGDRRSLSVKLGPLRPGVLTVKWSVVAEDGHRTHGSYDFTVAGGGA